MIQKQTHVRIIDNSGAKKGNVFFFYRDKINTKGLASKILLSLRRVVPNNAKKLRKGDKFKALIVQQCQPYASSAYYCKSFFNSVVLLRKNEEELLLGTRIYSRITKFVRYKGYNRIFMLSKGLY